MGWQAICEAEVVRVWAGQSDGAHDLAHLRRVWRGAQRIAAEMGCGDLEVIEAASFLHDIVNPPKDSPLRVDAARLSGEHAKGFLLGNGMGVAQVRNVVHAIEAHSFSAGIEAQTLEAQIVQDADRLEALGALGIARCFNVSGQMGAALFDADDPMGAQRKLDDRAYALDHFETKLLRLAERMNTAPAQRIAAERAAFMKMFRDQLLAEIN
jgi:uncharacterized protein